MAHREPGQRLGWCRMKTAEQRHCDLGQSLMEAGRSTCYSSGSNTQSIEVVVTGADETAEANGGRRKLTPDQLAAHDLLSELRTRISTQRLPYQYGVEST